MQVKINARELPFFDYIPAGYGKAMPPLFSILQKAAADIIMNAGDKISGYYIIIEGKVDFFNNIEDNPVETLPKGSSFGELSLVTLEEAAFTLKCKEKCVLLFLSRKKFSVS